MIIKLIIPFGPQYSLNISNMYEKFYTQNFTNENIKKTQIKSSEQLENADIGDSMSIGTLQPSNKNVINSIINNKVNIEKVLCFVWMFGIVLLVVILSVGNKKLKEIFKTSIKDINCSHKEILYNCMNTMNIKTELDLLYSSQ